MGTPGVAILFLWDFFHLHATTFFAVEQIVPTACRWAFKAWGGSSGYQLCKARSGQNGIPFVPDAVAILCVQDAKESATKMPKVIQISPTQQGSSHVEAHQQWEQVAQPDGDARQEDEGAMGICRRQQRLSLQANFRLQIITSVCPNIAAIPEQAIQ